VLAAAAAALALVVGAPAAASGQDAMATLEAAARGFAASWRAPDAGALRDHLAGEVRLDLPGGVFPMVKAHQAGAELAGLLRARATRSFTPVRVALSDGDDTRGFAEYRWAWGSAAASQSIVFVAFRRDAGGWRVEEIRVLR